MVINLTIYKEQYMLKNTNFSIIKRNIAFLYKIHHQASKVYIILYILPFDVNYRWLPKQDLEQLDSRSTVGQ